MGTSEHRTPQGKNTPKGGKVTGNQTPHGKNTPKGGKAIGNQTPLGKNTPKGGKAIGKQMTLKSPKFNKGALNGKPQGNFKTPQPEKAVKAEGKKTPKSAPPTHIKRKKLEEEIDEQLSDDEFEKLLGHMKATKDKKKAVTEGPDDDDKDDDDDMSDFDLDDDDEDDNEDISDDDEDDDDGSDDDDLLDDEDDDDDSDDEDLLDDEADEGDESDDEDEDDDDEEALAPAKKKMKSVVSPVTVAQKTKKQSAESKEVTKLKEAKVATKESKEASKQKSSDKNILKESKPTKRNRVNRTVLIKNLPLNASVGDIRDRCANVELITFSFIGQCKEGVAKIRFQTEADAEKYQNIVGDMILKDKGMYADFQRETIKQHQKAKSVEVDPKKLFVRHLPKNCNEEKLKSLFPGASSAVIPGKKRRSKYGFVNFSTEAAATDSLNKAQKKKLEFDGRTLEVQRANMPSADRKEKKRSISEGEDDETDQAPVAKKQKKDAKGGNRPNAKERKRRKNNDQGE